MPLSTDPDAWRTPSPGWNSRPGATPWHARHAPGATVPWPGPDWLMPLWLFAIAHAWATTTLVQMHAATQAAPELAGTLHAGAIGATVMRLFGALAESAAYVLLWRAARARLPYWRFFVWLIVGSTADLFAAALLHRFAPAGSGGPAWLVALIGPAALPHAMTRTVPGLATAFAGLGVLTGLRWLGSAWVQARALGRGIGIPLLLTAGLWLATHTALWWTLDLLRGRSVPR